MTTKLEIIEKAIEKCPLMDVKNIAKLIDIYSNDYQPKICIARKNFKNENELNSYINELIKTNSTLLPKSKSLTKKYKVFKIRTGNVLYIIIATDKNQIIKNAKNWLYYYASCKVYNVPSNYLWYNSISKDFYRCDFEKQLDDSDLKNEYLYSEYPHIYHYKSKYSSSDQTMYIK